MKVLSCLRHAWRGAAISYYITSQHIKSHHPGAAAFLYCDYGTKSWLLSMFLLPYDYATCHDTIRYDTIRYIRYDAIRHDTTRHDTTPFMEREPPLCIIPYCTIPYHTIRYCPAYMPTGPPPRRPRIAQNEACDCSRYDSCPSSRRHSWKRGRVGEGGRTQPVEQGWLTEMEPNTWHACTYSRYTGIRLLPTICKLTLDGRSNIGRRGATGCTGCGENR
ncbi:hypothetical protein F5Y14DRAFT_283522 [Nemania sp. NC0429]|nr:hypothetical protein F5Y14DRAFT_283522 [Nemania sp. NC0429]